jgi:hypothetical protein
MSSNLTKYLINKFLFNEFEKKTLPFDDEQFVHEWEKYIKIGESEGILKSLRDKIYQLNFPIEKNISQNKNYLDATKKGINPSKFPESTGIIIKEPNKIDLFIYKSPAGKVPVIFLENRSDFESFIRAIAHKNEPKEISSSMGAAMISGYNNWARINNHKENWEKSNKKKFDSWPEEFMLNLIPYPSLYKDKFILISKGGYSNISAKKIGLDEDEWINHSKTIRLEHECTHYFTKRFFGSMQNNMHDELLADYMGITAALGYFEPSWFLKFIGLETNKYRQGARLENYLGNPQISGNDFIELQNILRKASKNVGVFDEKLGETKNQIERTYRMIAISQFSLDKLANINTIDKMCDKYYKLKDLIAINY